MSASSNAAYMTADGLAAALLDVCGHSVLDAREYVGGWMREPSDGVAVEHLRAAMDYLRAMITRATYCDACDAAAGEECRPHCLGTVEP